ncbi:Alpha/Beta hydrolase protein [Aspergillus carlsbadensis]|nr:Alpha/Beta hydrolase protein [Aspergillus carlsbadensis]
MLPKVLLTAIAAIGALPFGVLSKPTHLPLLKLPYGTWQASKYNAETDFYTFENIRYAAPPVGPLRFARPQAPRHMKGIQDGSVSHICYQTPDESNPGNPTPDEDCLFLDVQVPAKVLRSKKKDASVIFVIHGGGFTGASKTGIDASGVVRGTGGNAILVTINYRLGAFGWLGGLQARQAKATNLGLHDQRAALEWVQKYIHLVGGNPRDVTVWGLSAGGGSIIPHITQYGGRRDPLFHKAFVQSPGWFAEWDLAAVDKGFNNFTNALGCDTPSTFDCLREVDASQIHNATSLLRRIGPIEDGDWLQSDPLIALKDGTYWKRLESVISTHVHHEIPWFLGPIESDADFRAGMAFAFEDKTAVRRIEKQYPPPNVPGSPFATHADRAGAVISDYIFVRNSVAFARAFSGKAFAGIFSSRGALHANDFEIPYYYEGTLNLTTLDPNLALAYQSYFHSQVLTGDANALRNVSTAPKWPIFRATNQGKFLNVTDGGFEIVNDPRVVSLVDFWNDIFLHLKRRSLSRGDCRWWLMRALAMDDALAVFGWMIYNARAIAYYVILARAKAEEDPQRLIMGTWLMILLYSAGTCAVKLSFAGTLYRIIEHTVTNRSIAAIAGATLAVTIAQFATTLFHCRPVNSLWTGPTPENNFQRDCNPDSLFQGSLLVQGIMILVADVSLGLVIPIRLLRKTQMPLALKISAGLTIGVGSLANVATGARAVYTILLLMGYAVLDRQVIWMDIEFAVSLIGIATTTLKPLLYKTRILSTTGASVDRNSGVAYAYPARNLHIRVEEEVAIWSEAMAEGIALQERSKWAAGSERECF